LSDREDPRGKLRELELELEEERGISKAKDRLLMETIKEMEAIYETLKSKLRDIREKDARLRRIEQDLVRLDRLTNLGELALSIAHEIKNPLISIEGLARRLEKEKDGRKVSIYAGLIEREAERLSNMLKKMLDFSKAIEPRREPVLLKEIIGDTLLFVEHHLSRFAHVALHISDGQNLPVLVDRIHVQQVLVNLLMNAAQAMPGGGEVFIEIGKEGSYAFLSVRDTGPGIAEEIRDRIFEPFFTTKPGGTGLGLSICKRLVEANGGWIEVESKEGQGSTFKVFLPLAEGH
jgi:signal transduction histidine kinase